MKKFCLVVLVLIASSFFSFAEAAGISWCKVSGLSKDVNRDLVQYEKVRIVSDFTECLSLARKIDSQMRRVDGRMFTLFVRFENDNFAAKGELTASRSRGCDVAKGRVKVPALQDASICYAQAEKFISDNRVAKTWMNFSDALGGVKLKVMAMDLTPDKVYLDPIDPFFPQ